MIHPQVQQLNDCHQGWIPKSEPFDQDQFLPVVSCQTCSINEHSCHHCRLQTLVFWGALLRPKALLQHGPKMQYKACIRYPNSSDRSNHGERWDWTYSLQFVQVNRIHVCPSEIRLVSSDFSPFLLRYHPGKRDVMSQSILQIALNSYWIFLCHSISLIQWIFSAWFQPTVWTDKVN